MASRYRWRQQLLGSLQGQLQLATYLVVFLGFTGASSVGLLIGQRQSIALCDKAFHGLQDDAVPIAAAAADPAPEIKGRATAHQHITAPDR